jgi:dTDP-4-dehydrorhamnose 3,5-epimerase
MLDFDNLLSGIRISELKKNVDERGFFGEIFRADWTELLQEDEIVQANLSVSFPGMIRAWHRHQRGQVDYFVVLQGAIKICAYDDLSGEINEIVSSEEKIQVVRIPGHYWHGFKSIGDKKAIVIYFVNRLYDYKNPDEERRPWNDPRIIDKKSGLVFDWSRPPYQ